MKLKSKQWLKAATIRAIKTVSQTTIATIGTSAMICEINWKVVFSSALVSGLLSILTSFAGLPEAE
ncbi:MAG: holin [Clostridia bacterium]|nr:holin [Clostridia bacterium]